MSRPKKQTVDYFPHHCMHKKTMFILEQKYGNDGYAFWFKLLEILGSTEGHCLHLKNGLDWEFLIAKTKLDKEKCIEILELLTTVEAIDKDLWTQDQKVWSDNFIENIKDAYRNRVEDIPPKPELLHKKPTSKEVSNVRKPHTILNHTKEDNTKEDNNIEQVITYLNEKADKNFKANTPVTIKHIKARLLEGYTIDDFKKVIDIKVAKWKTDPKMSDYLRPETLFGNKFDGYLNEKIIIKEKSKEQNGLKPKTV